MKHMKDLLQSDNVEDLEFHLDYLDMIHEMATKRGLDAKDLIAEKELVQKRLEELQQQS